MVEEDDQVTHLIRLGEKANTEDLLSKVSICCLLIIVLVKINQSILDYKEWKKTHVFIHPYFTISNYFFSIDVFKVDPNFQENEDKYKQIRSGRSHVMF